MTRLDQSGDSSRPCHYRVGYKNISKQMNIPAPNRQEGKQNEDALDDAH